MTLIIHAADSGLSSDSTQKGKRQQANLTTEDEKHIVNLVEPFLHVSQSSNTMNVESERPTLKGPKKLVQRVGKEVDLSPTRSASVDKNYFSEKEIDRRYTEALRAKFPNTATQTSPPTAHQIRSGSDELGHFSFPSYNNVGELEIFHKRREEASDSIGFKGETSDSEDGPFKPADDDVAPESSDDAANTYVNEEDIERMERHLHQRTKLPELTSDHISVTKIEEAQTTDLRKIFNDLIRRKSRAAVQETSHVQAIYRDFLSSLEGKELNQAELDLDKPLYPVVQDNATNASFEKGKRLLKATIKAREEIEIVEIFEKYMGKLFEDGMEGLGEMVRELDEVKRKYRNIEKGNYDTEAMTAASEVTTSVQEMERPKRNLGQASNPANIPKGILAAYSLLWLAMLLILPHCFKNLVFPIEFVTFSAIDCLSRLFSRQTELWNSEAPKLLAEKWVVEIFGEYLTWTCFSFSRGPSRTLTLCCLIPLVMGVVKGFVNWFNPACFERCFAWEKIQGPFPYKHFNISQVTRMASVAVSLKSVRYYILWEAMVQAVRFVLVYYVFFSKGDYLARGLTLLVAILLVSNDMLQRSQVVVEGGKVNDLVKRKVEFAL